MSRFYGSLQGSARTEATRRGSKSSGVSAHVRGWDIGGLVEVVAAPSDRDTVDFVLTGGSNDRLPPDTLISVTLTDDGPQVTYVGPMVRDVVQRWRSNSTSSAIKGES